MIVSNVGIALLVLFLGLGFYFYCRFPGFVKFTANQMRFATWRENWNLWFMNSYWLEFMKKLELNPNGIYSFDQAVKRTRNEFELGKLEYHVGNFSRAIAPIESSI